MQQQVLPGQMRSLVSERAERAALGWAAVMLVAPLAGVTKRFSGPAGADGCLPPSVEGCADRPASLCMFQLKSAEWSPL
ncbi:MAG: hypothetical protein CL478_03330 [Acidobacteria bacterium]|nr:hypothetical protein [Acidobacteriota bacterium]